MKDIGNKVGNKLYYEIYHETWCPFLYIIKREILNKVKDRVKHKVWDLLNMKCEGTV